MIITSTTMSYSWDNAPRSTFRSASVQRRISELTDEGFGVKMKFGSAAIEENAEKHNVRMILRDSHGRIQGFFFGKLISNIFYYSKVCMSAEAKGRGYGKALFKKLESFISQCDMVCAISQNPVIFRMMTGLQGDVYPFQNNYNTVDGMVALFEIVTNDILSKEDWMNLQINDGIIRSKYDSKIWVYESEDPLLSPLNLDEGDAYLITSLRSN